MTVVYENEAGRRHEMRASSMEEALSMVRNLRAMGYRAWVSG